MQSWFKVVVQWPQSEFMERVEKGQTWCQGHIHFAYRCKPGVRFYEAQTQICLWEFENDEDAVYFAINWA